LPIAFFRILKVSKAGGVQQVTELQSPLVAGLYVLLDIISVHLGKDEPGSCTPHDIEGELAEQGVH
jgi:hypothetical protein